MTNGRDRDLTAVVLTLNEERNLAKCLANLPNVRRVVVVDSGSVDKTIEIATGFGASVYSCAWRGFAGQRNFALTSCDITTTWTLFVDADEEYDETFAKWYDDVAADSNDIDVFMIPSWLVHREKTLRHAPGYPIFHPRLVRTTKTVFVRNHFGQGETVSSSARLGYASVTYLHYYYDGNLLGWMQKHIGIVKEMKLHAVTDREANGVRTLRGDVSRVFGNSIFRIPGRFIYHYVLRRGFLDGREGLEYSLMYAWFEATRYVHNKIRRYFR